MITEQVILGLPEICAISSNTAIQRTHMKEKLLPHLRFEPPALREVGFKVAKVKGINLAQGVCLMPVPETVKQGAFAAIEAGHNRYAPAQGILELRQSIAGKLERFNKFTNVLDSLIVTVGSTGAFEAVCDSFISKGDEVITFSPFYPYHAQALAKNQATMKLVELRKPNWSFDLQELERAFSPRTKFVLLITPHNPTGKVFSRTELAQIGEMCRKHNVFCVTDEVYEYMTYDGHEHTSIASLPEMFEHTITMGSYSKTFAITGWRIGYLVAPRAVIESLRSMSDQLYVCAPTPLQYGVAHGIKELGDDFYKELRGQYKHKRELLMNGLSQAGLRPIAPQGGYFILANTQERFPGISSEDAVEQMIERTGVGAVPASDFLGRDSRGDPQRSTFLRFCFGVPDEMLQEAASRLERL